MPAASPSYPRGLYRFVDCEYMIVVYESDPDGVRDELPEPLEPDGSNQVLYEFIKMPDSSGFGDYTESGVVIPAGFQGEDVNFTAQMYLGCHSPIAGGEEIWGFPKKLGHPKLEIQHDILTGVLNYADVRVAIATMAYKHENLVCPDNGRPISCDANGIVKKMQKTQVNLKIIPDIDGSQKIVQLVGCNLERITVKDA